MIEQKSPQKAESNKREIEITLCHDIFYGDNIHDREQGDEKPQHRKKQNPGTKKQSVRNYHYRKDQKEGHDKGYFKGRRRMLNDIIGIKIYGKKKEPDIRGKDFRHGQKVYPDTVLRIGDVRLCGVVQEHKTYQNIIDTSKGITEIVADMAAGQPGLTMTQDVIANDEYRQGDSHFLGKQTHEIAYERNGIPEGKSLLTGLEVEMKGSEVKSGRQKVFTVADGIDSLCKNGVSAKDQTRHNKV